MRFLRPCDLSHHPPCIRGFLAHPSVSILILGKSTTKRGRLHEKPPALFIGRQPFSFKLLVYLLVTLSWLEPKACFPTQYAFPMSRGNRAAAVRSAPAGTRHHSPLWHSPIFAETAASFGTQTWHLHTDAAL